MILRPVQLTGARKMMVLSGLFGLLLLGFSLDALASFDSGTGTGAPDDAAPDLAPAGTGADGATDLLDDPPSDGADILWGGDGADSIVGGGGDDQINGYGSDDTLLGGDGADSLHGGAGNDRLLGGPGNDALSGEDGGDSLFGDAGGDHLAGYFGDDLLDGGEGADLLQGGAGADTLLGGAGNDSLQGGEGADSLSGGTGSDELFGDAGNDLLDGRVPDPETGAGDTDTGQDLLNGGRGNDTLILGSNDLGHGGEGADLYALGGWIDPAAPATIVFDPAEDHIALVYDPATHANPLVTLEPSATAPDAVWVLLDGVPLAEVLHGAGLTAADIALLTPEVFAAR